MELEIKEIINDYYGISHFPKEISEAMAYVPYQINAKTTYSPAQAFVNGTLFPSLNKPFYGKKCEAHYD